MKALGGAVDAVAGPRAATAPVAPEARRRVSLPATGLLAMLAVVALALLLAAIALQLRSVVEHDLVSLEQAQLAGASVSQQLADARRHIDAGAVVFTCLAWLSVTAIGAVALLYFSRMAADIRVLRTRALAIVTGERGHGQPLQRNDELSDLAQAVDNLADALAVHERDLEIERFHVIHRERLAAIGAMAEGVLREIGNPIAAIDGYARSLQQGFENCACEAGQAAPAEPQAILRETARLVAITREIAELAAAPASAWQLASLNDVVVQTVGLLRYEPRLERVSVVTALDPQLPAVVAAADRLVQLLMNLVINAADATAGLPARTARIDIATRRAPGGVELCVTDNGCGMSEDVLQRVFEPLFTTKPAGRGTGLGLPLCRAIATDHGGRISVDSVPDQGTRVTVRLPVGDSPRAATVEG